MAAAGPIALGPDAGPTETAYYLAEFVRFAPSAMRPGALCDANLSFKRSFLDRNRERLQPGLWPSGLLEGRCPLASEAAVEYLCPDDLGAAMGQRFRYGRRYAASRVARRWLYTRLPYAAGAAALPALLLLRQGRDARRAGLSGAFWSVLPRTLLLDAAWAGGECLGYAAGSPSARELR